MFSKLTPAALCVCSNNSSASRQGEKVALFARRPQLNPTSHSSQSTMIDTQIQRDAAMISRISSVASLQEQMDKMAAKHAHADQANNCRNNAHVNIKQSISQMNAANRRKTEDINCNTNTTQDASKQRAFPAAPQHNRQPNLQPLSKVMSINAPNVKRSPKSLDVRKEEVMAIRNRFPTKVPIIVQRFCKETALPQLDKSKYLVPQEITMSQFLTIIRNRMRINSTQTLYLLVNNRSMISLSLTLAEVYNEYAGMDGFLYVTYASQEVFGASSTAPVNARVSPQSLSQHTSHNPCLQAMLSCKHHANIESTPMTCCPCRLCLGNANKSHFDAFLDNTYKSMCFG